MGKDTQRFRKAWLRGLPCTSMWWASRNARGKSSMAQSIWILAKRKPLGSGHIAALLHPTGSQRART